MLLLLVVCLGSHCTGEPGDAELKNAAGKATALLREFKTEYENVAQPADCTRVLNKYTRRWQNEIIPMQQAGIAKKGRVSELEAMQKFSARNADISQKFRDAFLNAYELGKRKAQFCGTDPEYRRIQESAWRTFLGLPKKP